VMDDEMKATYGVERFVDGLTGHDLFVRQAFAPTCNIAGLESGYTGEGSKTVLPARAMAKIDFRLVPDQEPGDILAKLRAHLDTQGYSDIRITTCGTAEPVVTSLEAPIVQRIAAIAESFEGKRPSITPLSGGTLPLLGALKRQVGVPGLSAPGNAVYYGSLAHSPNEHIRLADLARAVRFNCHLFTQLGA
jgi:acetylornithine deacetylase/succinyl-diaminopimelate desuccinylase-like protein